MTTHHGDCRDILPQFDPAGVDAVVTDPPYGLKFMGKGWDHGVPGPEYWTGVKRTMRPGAFLLAFGGTRTYHRLAVAIEDAGFEILDTVLWLYGSGFPKSKTRLKPAWEPITLARAPGPTRHLQIDDCRIEGQAQRPGTTPPSSVNGRRNGQHDIERVDYEPHEAGRWPANVILDEDAAALLDAQSGTSKSAIRQPSAIAPTGNGLTHGTMSAIATERGHADIGGASRFFYCAKASRAERNAGLDGMPERAQWSERLSQPYSMGIHEFDGRPKTRNANHHPTVKPIAVMRWLVRLITPPGGTVLDPFAGSGTTGIAAALEGREYIGIDKDAEYCEIAERRIAHWSAQPRALELTL